MENPIQIKGIGHYAPEKVISNHDFEQMMDTTDEWITTRSGIQRRHYASPEQASSDLGYLASLDALKDAGMDADQIDLIIVGTSSPDMLFPSTACIIADQLHIKSMAFDVSAGCSGFAYSLSIATQFLKTGHYKNALVIGADTISRFIDFSDRSTAVLFGDGGGAIILSTENTKSEAILAITNGSDGSGACHLLMPAGGSRIPATVESVKNHGHFVHMNGKEIFKFAVRISDDIVDQLLTKSGKNPDDIDHYLFHQANARIIESAVKRLHVPDEKVIITLDEYGNTSSATVPMALSVCAKSGRIKNGDLILIAVFGAGLTWGGILLRWNKNE
jgi:3-oxoacyl-[acyl-carrier-protein] synthase-3